LEEAAVTDEAPSRRAVLAAAIRSVPLAAVPLTLAACRGVQVLGSPPVPPVDIRTLSAAITAEKLMLARYAAAIRALPAGDTTAVLAARTVQAEHTAHLVQLTARLIEPAPHPSATPRAVTIPPGSTGSILAILEQAEQAASDRLIGQLRVLPPALAQLFASIAASEATHVPYLRAAGGTA
jgi:Ferritin-like domain